MALRHGCNRSVLIPSDTQHAYALRRECGELLLTLPRTLYAVVCIAVCLRIMPFFRYYKSVGVLTIVLGSMMKDVKVSRG